MSQEIVEDQVTSPPLDDLDSPFQKFIFGKLMLIGAPIVVDRDLGAPEDGKRCLEAEPLFFDDVPQREMRFSRLDEVEEARENIGMKRYRLIIYWWDGPSHEHRLAGGEYLFESPDDGSVAKLAHVLFEEQINLADQSVVVDEFGHIVWQNEPVTAPPDNSDQAL